MKKLLLQDEGEIRNKLQTWQKLAGCLCRLWKSDWPRGPEYRHDM